MLSQVHLGFEYNLNMTAIKEFFRRWGFSLLMMATIFAFSSTPGSDLPSFGSFDYFVKKGGHMFGYGLLALTYWYGLGLQQNRSWLAWLMAVLYAATDEFHQSFVPGRHPSLVDVLFFDGGGAAILILASLRFIKPEILERFKYSRGKV